MSNCGWKSRSPSKLAVHMTRHSIKMASADDLHIICDPPEGHGQLAVAAGAGLNMSPAQRTCESQTERKAENN